MKEQKIVQGIVDISHGLGMKVIAEGVETQEQFELLKRFGCDSFQGYLFSPPVPVGSFTDNLIKWKGYFYR